MASPGLNSLVQAVGYILGNKQTTTSKPVEYLGNIAIKLYGEDDWLAALETWLDNSPDLTPTSRQARKKVAEACDIHIASGDLEAARGIWEAGEEQYGGYDWSPACPRQHG